ncbi:unnamed protein product [Acanthoscelides obtectus]|uniref:Uncharacterized protein n=1 Tax=Acanthoscelides obtectus TaxID=200917 RepID=A0A9P0KGA5_ACAOB|nr:unnamed protein product [Acanthoscelides obtectus]CAK1656666.1 hypothetical protein AOBTE_LOCUS19854 [Acanthoscelides obtectus]
MEKSIKLGKELLKVKALQISEDDEYPDENEPKIQIKSFDSRAGAGTINALGRMVAISLMVVLYEKIRCLVS